MFSREGLINFLVQKWGLWERGAKIKFTVVSLYVADLDCFASHTEFIQSEVYLFISMARPKDLVIYLLFR